MQIITKQKKWWKRSLTVMLSLTLVTSSVSLTGLPKKAQAAEPVSPGGLSTQPVLWLKANDGVVESAGELTHWADQSIDPVNFTLDVPQGEEVRIPKYNENGVNFNPSVKFDNLNKPVHYNQSAKLVGDKQITFQSGYAVYKWPETGTGTAGVLVGSTEIKSYGAQILGGGGSGGNYFAISAGQNSTWRSFGPANRKIFQMANYEMNDDGTNALARVNGQPATVGQPTVTIAPFAFTPVIGATAGTSGSNYSGSLADVAEIILYDGETSADAAKIETYLAVKYGITLNDGTSNYVATNNTVVWDATENTEYRQNIAGIGRDNAEELEQKQSRSINEGTQVAIGVEALTATNLDNQGTLTDGQYLIWADNGKDLAFTKQIGTTNKNHAERIWKVQNTGSVGKVEIAIPKSALPENATLRVGNSDTDFEPATEYTLAEITLSGTPHYAAKITLEDGQYFTFAAPVPELASAIIEKIGTEDHQITLTFNQEVTLTDLTGFTITLDGAPITPTFVVDLADNKKLNLMLPTGTDVTGKAVKVVYDGDSGNLKNKNHNLPARSFDKDIALVDKSQLQAKVTEVDALTEINYTPESWANLQTVLTTANIVLANPDATQEAINKALNDLTTAQNALKVPAPTMVALEQTVADGNKVTLTFNQDVTLNDLTGFTMTVGGNQVTPEWTVDPIDPKKLIFTLPDGTEVTNQEVKVVYNGTGTLKGVNGIPVVDFERVAEDPYSAALTITQPATSTNNPQPTFGGTVFVDTTTPSTVTIDLKGSDNQSIPGAGGLATINSATGEWIFTPSVNLPDGTYTIIATATNGQQTVTKKHTFTVATTPIVNKVPLQQKVEEAKNLVAGEYTPASWAQYQEALKKANEVLTNPNATQEEVDKALAVLTGAQNALVKIGKVGKGLGTLNPSTGTLSPSFQTGVTDYTMTVGDPTSVIDFAAIPVEAGATVTTTVNGQPGTIGQIPLQVGENIIVISVKDANGNVRQYTIKVYREAYTGGGGSWTPNPTPPVTPTPGDIKTKIQVELEIDGEKPLEKTTVEIERTKHANGDITDFVALTEANAKEAVAKAKEIGNNIARIVLPDVNDEVKEAKVEIPKESLKLLRDNGLSFEISSENGHIAIPVSSMEGIDDNFYFRLVPVKKESERQAIEERARAERVVRETLQSNDVHVVARPMTIETNMPSRPVQVTLPLKGVKIPTNTAEREAFLKQLAVFIEHSDGEKKVVIPEVVTMAKGELGSRFTVEKFSTFSIIQVNKKEETKPPLEVKEHEAYIKGFPDGTFGPEKNVTRAQVATMIARILGYTDGTVNTAPFKDIPSDHYAAGAIAFVKERGIMNGDVNGNFRASENITRAQMATVVANFKQLSIEENVAITFNDTKGHWAQWMIEANRAAGIINGRQDGSFAPDEHLTRAQAVVMMNRMFERGPLQGVTTPSFPDVKATHWAFDEIEEAAKSHAYFIDEEGQEQSN